MNALARAIFFGKHGELRERALQDQLQLGWEHVNFLGEYKFDLKQITSLKGLRPLKHHSNEVKQMINRISLA
ncbi:hypothetical protein BC351_14860 [Paenibacillus ferrarius]|uniref:Tn3 transposase DDE domain-containing protein n=1 Tax=Paenibacillus ferrarius TaxID=1469647 RepID=A0A1V4HRG4_9BACL|nr:hypothetical protein BC351_14860 [Paenibacillus ferrarius]